MQLTGVIVRILLGLSFLLFATAAPAGLFSSKLSESDAAHIHKVAVFSCLGDTLYVDSIGFTAFNNHGFQAPVSDWNMDASIVEHVNEVMRQHGRWPTESLKIGSDQVPWKTFLGTHGAINSEGRQRLMEQAKTQGADALLVICREENPHDQFIKPGFGIYARSGLGKQIQYLMASYYIKTSGVPGDNVLAQQHPDPLLRQEAPRPLKDSWDVYTPEEQAALQADLKKFIYDRVDQVLQTMNLLSSGG